MNDNIMQRKFSNRCRHNKYIIDTSLNTVECGICHNELNPIWVFEQFVNRENRFEMRLAHLEKMAKKADVKNSCKCMHCKKMTRIQRS